MTLLLSLLLVVAFFVLNPSRWGIHPSALEPSSLWTHTLVHLNGMHLSTNLLTFGLGGWCFERRWGARALIPFVLGACAVTGLAELGANPDYSGCIIGVSGVACALLGASAACSRAMAAGSIVLGLGLLGQLALDEPGIAHYAHLSGLLLGWGWALLDHVCIADKPALGLESRERDAQPAP